MSLEKPTCFTRLMVRLGGLIGSRYHTTNFGTIIRHWRLLLAALSRAFWIAGSGVNPPHVIHSWVKKTAGSPDPHPMSRTDPVISPVRTSSVNSLRGRPISQGGVPRYAKSKKSIPHQSFCQDYHYFFTTPGHHHPAAPPLCFVRDHEHN